MKRHKLNTLLFDLDGTLLKLPMDTFLPVYMKDVASFINYEGGEEALIEALWTASLAVVKDGSSQKTNEDVFFDTFCSLVSSSKAEWRDLFTKYYQTSFPLLRRFASYDPFSLKIVQEAQKKRFLLVLATNPVFPKIAIAERLKWAGLSESDFTLITCLENMHSCKPSPSYYREILQYIGRAPRQCLMVGNDTEDDLSAGKVGIATYLVEDMLIQREKKQDILCDGRGTLKEFYLFLKNLAPV